MFLQKKTATQSYPDNKRHKYTLSKETQTLFILVQAMEVFKLLKKNRKKSYLKSSMVSRKHKYKTIRN